MDCRESGEVWYRAASDEAVVNLASDWVEAAGFSRAFSPAEVFVATWERVGYFDAKGDKVNTFQGSNWIAKKIFRRFIESLIGALLDPLCCWQLKF